MKCKSMCADSVSFMVREFVAAAVFGVPQGLQGFMIFLYLLLLMFCTYQEVSVFPAS